MDAAVHGRPGNRLLQALPDSEYAQITPLLTPVTLALRKKLHTARHPIDCIYFLESGIASVVVIGGMERRQTEVGIIGREGVTGFSLALGARCGPYDILVQLEGAAHVMKGEDFTNAIAENPRFRELCLLFVHTFNVQTAHTALANAQARIGERLARWLLMAQDRADASELYLTHDFLALMLGVRRAGVTVALHNLEESGLIETARGRVVILDRDRLREHAKGFYGAPEAEYDRLLEVKALRRGGRLLPPSSERLDFR